MSRQITVEAVINAPLEKVWAYYTEPAHITRWNAASPDWHCPRAENDLRTGGRFSSRMEARDGSTGFDFSGTYDEVVPDQCIAYTMDGDDARKASVSFAPEGEGTKVWVTFDAETENPVEMQRAGWQSILENFKTHTETN